MVSKKFAWLYLVENGNAGQKPAYYGGFETIDKNLTFNTSNYGRGDAFNDLYLHEIKTYGVNWEKTKAPSSDSVSKFTDTFNDPEYEEYLFGTLVLKNGIKQKWSAESLKVTNVFDMMAQVYTHGVRFRELFGEEL